MKKDRPINIKKLEKMCTSHLTTTKIRKINNEYIIVVYNTKNQIHFTSKKIEEKNSSYKKLLNEIMIMKKNMKSSTLGKKIWRIE